MDKNFRTFILKKQFQKIDANNLQIENTKTINLPRNSLIQKNHVDKLQAQEKSNKKEFSNPESPKNDHKSKVNQPQTLFTKKEKKKLKAEFRKLKKCNTKYALHRILLRSSDTLRKLILFYIEDCFLFHTHWRKIKCKEYLISQRDLFYQLVKNPEVLDDDCHFNKNIIKNFCNGVGSFLLAHFLKIYNHMQSQDRGKFLN